MAVFVCGRNVHTCTKVVIICIPLFVPLQLTVHKLSIYKSSLAALKGNIVSSILQIDCQSGDISSCDCPAVNKDSLLQSKVSIMQRKHYLGESSRKLVELFIG